MTSLENTALAAIFVPNRKIELASRQRLWGLLFLSPWIVGFLIFTAAPILVSLFFTFTDFNLSHTNDFHWIGLANWSRLFTDADSLDAISTTLRFALLSIPFAVVLPIAMAALLLAKPLRGRRFFLTLFYLPYIVPQVSAAFVWERFLNSDSGWFGHLLRALGIANPPNMLFDPHWVLVAFTLISLWGVGNAMLLTHIAMRGIPRDMYDAANVDGANAWVRFVIITLPMITPIIFYNLVSTVIGVMQYFTIPYVLSNFNVSGGGNFAISKTLFMNIYLYKTAFTYADMGYAATQAWLVFIIGLSATLILFASAPFWVYYANAE
jgi:multiple sugar transport system permease protein